MEIESNFNGKFFSCQNLQLDMDLFMESDATISPKSTDGKQFITTIFDYKKQQMNDFDRFCGDEELNLSSENYSIYQNIGGQRKMLDRFSKHQFMCNGEIVEFYGIFDGHGNNFIAEYLAQNLHLKLQTHTEILSNTIQAINQVFKEIDEEMLKKMTLEQENSGSTALCVLLTSSHIITINLGDSRALLMTKNGDFEQLTDDQKPSRPDEKQRIEALEGGYVIPVGKVQRVQGVLAVSRSFGNKKYRPYISAEPEIRIYSRPKNTQQKLLLATDGLFNESSNENIVQKINQLENEQEISQKLYAKILEENEFIKDNTTIILIDL